MSSTAPVVPAQPESPSPTQPVRGGRPWWLILPCAIAGLILGVIPAYRSHLTAIGKVPPQSARIQIDPPQPDRTTPALAPGVNHLSAIEQAILDTQAGERIHARSGDTAAYAADQHREQLLEISFHSALAKLAASERRAAEADLNQRELVSSQQAESALQPPRQTATQPDPPQPPTPVPPYLLTRALAGTSAGAVFGAILALFLPRRKPSHDLLPETTALSEPGPLPPLRCLGEIPDLTDFVTVGPYDPFQILGFTLLLEDGDDKAPPGGVRSFAIASAHPGAGKTLIAANLAIALSRTELRVLLIDANLQHPAVHAQFELRNRSGLASLLSGKPTRESIAAITLPTLYPRLSILPAGSSGAQPNFSLFPQMLSSLAGDFDLVFVDLPSLESAQAFIAAKCCQRTLLIVPAAEEAPENLRQIQERLATRNIHLAGTVLNHKPQSDHYSNSP